MHHLLIVEDDRVILNGLAESIPWEEHGVRVVAAVPDGQAALEILTEQTVDIVLSDIDMPVMDGLELASAIAKQYPQIRLILLSGFETFHYAQQAIHLNVFDYLLKTDGNDTVLQTVLAAIEQLEKEKNLQRQVYESIPLLKQQFFQRLLTAKLAPAEITDRIEFLGIKLKGPQFVTAVLEADDYFHEAYSSSVLQQELLKRSIIELMHGLLPDALRCELFNGEHQYLVALLELEQETEQDVYRWFETIRQHVEIKLKTTVTIGVGSIYTGLENTHGSYARAVAALGMRIFLGKNQVIQDSAAHRLTPAGETDLSVIFQVEQRLGNGLKLGALAECSEIVAGIKQALTDQGMITLNQLRLIAMRITLLVFQSVYELERIHKENKGPFKKYSWAGFAKRLEKLDTIAEHFGEIQVLITSVCEYAQTGRSSGKDVTVDRATEFLMQNYFNPELSLELVANEVHVSPIYLSIIFKEKKQINFSEFLAKLRIDQACQMMRNTDLKNYEIAERTGFANPHYFGICFKKYTGCTPTEFRSRT